MTEIPEDVMTSAFDDWLNEREGFALRAERVEFNLEWMQAAFQAGAEAQRERDAKTVEDWMQFHPNPRPADLAAAIRND